MDFTVNKEPSSSSSYRENMHVAIVGGGLSGLATALALQKIGIHCTVFEKDSCFSDRMQGYGLTLTNNPKGPLNTLGLLDECIERDCPSNAHWVRARIYNQFCNLIPCVMGNEITSNTLIFLCMICRSSTRRARSLATSVDVSRLIKRKR